MEVRRDLENELTKTLLIVLEPVTRATYSLLSHIPFSEERGDLKKTKKQPSFIPLISDPINKIFPYFYADTPQVNKVFSQFRRVIIDFYIVETQNPVTVFYERYSRESRGKIRIHCLVSLQRLDEP